MAKNDKKRGILSSVLGKIKLHPAGKKMKRYGCMPVKSSSSKTEMIYPSLYLDTKQAPELKNYEVEDKVMIIIEGVITSHHLDESETRSNETFDIKIKKLGVKPK